MRALLLRTVGGFLALFAVVALAVFLAAGTLYYWQGWLLLGVFFGGAGVITFWLWGHDRALLERRVKAGPGAEASDPVQNAVQGLASLAFLATLIVPALDHRFGWSRVPPQISVLGAALVALGYFIVFLVFRENSFTAATIQVTADQKVIDTGPYALVRHPMYAGALVMFVGIPLALGSWWGLLAAASIAPILAWRLAREEAFLATHLAGYGLYRARVRSRLAPGLW